MKIKKADQFASYLLVPPVALYEAVQKYKSNTGNPLSLNEIIRLEQHFGISHQAILVRLAEEKEISDKDISAMQNGIISAAARLGFDVSLYKPSPENKKIQVLGYYICQADKLLQAEMISVGKYEELLLDAFRDDIVFGDDEEDGDVID